MPNSKLIPIEKIKLPPSSSYRPPLLTEDEIETARLLGLTTPVWLRPIHGESEYYLVGETRSWWIAQQAMIPEIPAVITEMSEAEAKAFERKETPMSKARSWAYQYEQELNSKKRGALTRTALTLGVSKPSLHRALQLLKLPHNVQKMIDDEQISPSVAGLLLKVNPYERESKAKSCIGKSYNEAKKILLKTKTYETNKKNNQKSITLEELFEKESKQPETSLLENQLSELTGTPVKILEVESEEGALVLKYHNYEVLEGLMERLGWQPEF